MRITTIAQVWMVVAVTVSTARETGAGRRTKRGIKEIGNKVVDLAKVAGDKIGDGANEVWSAAAYGMGGRLPFPCAEDANIPCKQATNWAKVCDTDYAGLYYRGKFDNFQHCWHWYWVIAGKQYPDCKKAWDEGWAQKPWIYYNNPYYKDTAIYWEGREWTSEREDCPNFIPAYPKGCEEYIKGPERPANCPPIKQVDPPEWKAYWKVPTVPQQKKIDRQNAKASRMGGNGMSGQMMASRPESSKSDEGPRVKTAPPKDVSPTNNKNNIAQVPGGQGSPTKNNLNPAARVPGGKTQEKMKPMPAAGGPAIA
ncbi:MAG: hypothetical protein M1823_001480 [Watsoniomyces obsoletus]|nr:MAG: hypothetical protein M1823_001480 [Watsoniomyces obsoletus]